MKIKFELIYLILIVLTASVLRLWSLGAIPPSPDWDEAALGYNAWSIMHNGRDEYGEFMPLILRSFDDYKPALYMYFIIPFILIFDLTTLAVRLPSAVFGILSTIALYLLVKELLNDHKNRTGKHWIRYLPIVSAFIFAISPQSIQFSRVAFETNTAASFNIFAALLFLWGLKRHWLLLLSTFLMGMNLHVYQSTKVFMPLFALALIIIFYKKLLVVPKKYLAAAVVTGLIAAFPLIHYSFTNEQAFMRARGVSIFSEHTAIKQSEEKKWTEDHESGNMLGRLFHNQWVTYGREIMEGYLLHYDLNWMFIRGDLARHHAPGMSIMYLWDLPFFLFGIYLMIFSTLPRKFKLLIFSWFLLAPVPAMVTNGLPHTVRTLNFLPTFQIFIAIGIIGIVKYVASIKYQVLWFKVKYLLMLLILLAGVFNFLYYLNQYFVQQNYFASHEWQYGYEEAVAEVAKIEKDFDRIIVSNEHPLDQSYMFFLFYLKYPPVLYQNEDPLRTGGFREVHKFGKYEFRPLNWKEDKDIPNKLMVGSYEDFNDGGQLIKQINYLNGKPAIYIYR